MKGSALFQKALAQRTRLRDRRRSWLVSIIFHLIGVFLVYYFYKPPNHIADAEDVSSTIYDTKGAVVRHAELKREISCQKNGDPPAGAPHYYKSYTSAYDSLKRRLYTMKQVTVTGRENTRIERRKNEKTRYPFMLTA